MSDMSAEENVSDVDSDAAVGYMYILRRLENDDPELTELWVKLVVGGAEVRTRDGYIITDVEGVRDTEVLGKYLGRCTHITHLSLSIEEGLDADDIVAPFLAGLQSNRSVSALELLDFDDIPHDFFRMLAPFIARNLSFFRMLRFQMDVDQYRSLALALREGKSLKDFSISPTDRYDHEESIIANIEALKMHPQLERLRFGRFSLGRNACTALSDLSRQSDGMQTMSLSDNDIDDSGVEALVEGLAHCRHLQSFQLATNPSITIRGWSALAALLEDPNSRLALLNLMGNGINDESAILFANALARNKTLDRLFLDSNPNITSDGWAAFSKVLCDTSSVNSTFLSNHSLERFSVSGEHEALADDIATVASLLALNEQDDKKMVALRKILQYHDDFEMQPLFEWDLKVLPYVVDWFEIAAAYEIETEEYNRKRKLAAIYQFVRGMPELSINGIAGTNTKSAKVGGKRPYSDSGE